MKTTLIMGGGLGNQMYQYAFVMALRNKGHVVTVDTSIFERSKAHYGYELEKVFQLKEPVKCNKGTHLLFLRGLYRLHPTSLTYIDGGGYHPEMLVSPKRYLYGYWQDSRYFSDIKEDILKVFSFADIDHLNMSVASEMATCDSVSIHVRRGDYAIFGMPLLGLDYYRKGVAAIKAQIENPKFFIFSDDEEEAKSIADDLGVVYELINWNKGEDSYKDMFLMSKCKHNIIANSTFSWWAGYLNSNSEKLIIAP